MKFYGKDPVVEKSNWKHVKWTTDTSTLTANTAMCSRCGNTWDTGHWGLCIFKQHSTWSCEYTLTESESSQKDLDFKEERLDMGPYSARSLSLLDTLFFKNLMWHGYVYTSSIIKDTSQQCRQSQFHAVKGFCRILPRLLGSI